MSENGDSNLFQHCLCKGQHSGLEFLGTVYMSNVLSFSFQYLQKVGLYQGLMTCQIGSQRVYCKTPLQNLRTPHQSWNSRQNQSWTLILQSQTSSDHEIQTRILHHLPDHQHHPKVFAWCQESSPQPGGLQFVQGGRSIALVRAPCSEDVLLY